MAASSNSSVNSKTSCLEVYQCWLRDNSKPNGDSIIPINEILIGLRYSQLWSINQRQLVESQPTDMEKLWKLFNEIMPGKGEAGVNQVVEILKANNSDQLADDLWTKYYGPEASTLSIQNPSSTSKVQAQVHLSRLIKENVDFMAQYWSDIIPIAETCEAFVKVQVVKNFKSTSGIPVNKIQDVFDKDEQTIYKRIVIQGDPGCGKTTFVNKIAIDWANQDEYLRSKFDFVFLIELKVLTMSVDDTIKTLLPKSMKCFFDGYTESAESKILLILDGFDELQETSQWYQDVTNLLESKSPQFQFFDILVTSRRSHIDKIPNKVRGRCLLIKGFDQQSMKQFLNKQHVPLPSVGQESNLSHLLQTPLFCAIYCSLHVGGEDPIELEDSYDLIKALVDNSVTVKKKTAANVEEQLDEIGKFAFQMLDSKSLKFMKKFCRSSEVIKPSFDLSRVNLDLLIKRTIPTRGYDRFKEEFSLPHQLIAEYLAARYFARSSTKEQLKQADASALIPAEFNRVLDLPFVRFFLFELLFLYLEKTYDESVFDNFLNIPQLRLIWNCKSNKDIPTLENVIDLNFYLWNHELVNHSRFIPTLSKYRNLSSLNLYDCGLSKNQVEQLVNFINNNCFQQLIKLDLGVNGNVGSTPQLFTALSKCKHLEGLYLHRCNLTVESTTELARCIDNNGLADLTQLQLDGNGDVGSTPQLFTALSKCKHLQGLDLEECEMTVESTTELAGCIDNNGLADLTQLQLDGNRNVGSSTELLHVLYKCPQLQKLHLVDCSMRQESLNIFLSTFNSNTFQQLNYIWLLLNKEIKVDDNFFIALEKCPKISTVGLSKYMKSNLSEVGRKAKETLEQRGCQFIFY